MLQNPQISSGSFFTSKSMLCFKDNVSALKEKIYKHDRDIIYSSEIAYYLVKATINTLHQVKNFLLLSCKVAGSVTGCLFGIAGVVSWALQTFIINPIRVAMHLGLADAGKFYLNRLENQYSALKTAYQQGGKKAATTHLLKLSLGVLKDILDDCSNTELISKYCIAKVLTAAPASATLLAHPATALGLLAIVSCVAAVFLLVRNNLPSIKPIEQRLATKYPHNDHKSTAIKFLPKIADYLLSNIQGKYYSKLEDDIEKYKEKNKINHPSCSTPFKDQPRLAPVPTVEIEKAA